MRRLSEDNTILNEKIVHRDNNSIEDRATIILNAKNTDTAFLNGLEAGGTKDTGLMENKMAKELTTLLTGTKKTNGKTEKE